jgi:hypothetical protein
VKELVDLELIISVRPKNGLSIKVHRDEDDYMNDNGAWLPLSQIEVVEKPGSKIATITMPVWLAEEKGLI